MRWIALDIGGANVKIADGAGFAACQSFALWREPQRLTQVLRSLIAEAPPCDRLAATMTGELADCFATKAEGVGAILDAVCEAADGRHARIYLTSGKLVTPQVARQRPILAAASNWHALARFATRFLQSEHGLLLDIGSTTSDLIPLSSAGPANVGATDIERLVRGELLYTGVRRTPVCGVAGEVAYRNHFCPVAQELFATMHDVYVILGEMPEEPTNHETADGRSATKPFARARLARMLCADGDEFNHRDAVALAKSAARSQCEQIALRLQKVWGGRQGPPATVVTSGSGEFLARDALVELGWEVAQVSLHVQLGALLSTCATAHALAVLAREGSTA